MFRQDDRWNGSMLRLSGNYSLDLRRLASRAMLEGKHHSCAWRDRRCDGALILTWFSFCPPSDGSISKPFC